MCTISLLRAPWLDNGVQQPDMRWRVVFNRDERRDRSTARPPDVHEYGSVAAVHPLDPQGGGTWIAATSAGLVFALLNGPDRLAVPRPISRGSVIPALASCGTLADTAKCITWLDITRLKPFRLLVIDEASALECVSDGRRLSLRWPREHARLMRTSSSARPEMVRRRRMALFDRSVPPGHRRRQDAFHWHQWSADPASSVRMARRDAATISQTTVEVFADRMRLGYRPVPVSTEAVTELLLTA